MAREIERKFLVNGRPWTGVPGERIIQCYPACEEGRTVRLRLSGEQAWITLKGPADQWARDEFEFEIPAPEAREMMRAFSGMPRVEKTRHRIPHGRHVWEVDVFHGAHDGLVLAEVELNHPAEEFGRPDWLGPEVSGDPKFFNSRLARGAPARENTCNEIPHASSLSESR